ncbi:glycine zipper 2TM domain-containing protein [Nitrincola alkalilacustris]|uniref:glycine zipper 2TM domain-containing protein n=1 Tax=Nitrincola alkalilacustris TaxID=1571224 RepID=UPI00124DF223|nr:glycine zipper 2TM domain-containing protein [Nitrincola alkalilacustris]
MKTLHKGLLSILVAVLFIGLTGCNNLSKRDQNMVIGAGVGAVGGAVLTGGSTLGTVGGAAVGGYIGREINR